jgi:hypothetical protein
VVAPQGLKKENQMDTNETYETPRDKSRAKMFAVAGVAVVLAASNGYLLYRVNQLDSGVLQSRAVTSQEMSSIRDAVSTYDSTHAKKLEALRADLDEARHQASATAGRARNEALKHADKLAKQLAEQELQRQQQVTSELSEIKQSAATTNTKIADVSSDVAATKTDVAATRSDLQNTVADLKRMTGDMGVMSGQIATNGTELAALRALGERNYFEFNVAKSKMPQKVGNIQLWVKKTDPKRNKFTLTVLADDKTVEKRDKTINEPVQFYVAKTRQPYEIVVNEVTKDHVVGYLATPKVQLARN